MEQQDDLSLGNARLKEQALTYLDGFISECHGLSPTSELTQRTTDCPLAASDLKLEKAKVSGHFSRFVPESTHTDWLQTAIKHMFEQPQGRQLMVHIGTCGGEIEKRVAALVGSNDSPHILSEAELRYAVGDPLLDMLVTCWGFRVTLLLYCNPLQRLLYTISQQAKLEERVDSEHTMETGTPGPSIPTTPEASRRLRAS